MLIRAAIVNGECVYYITCSPTTSIIILYIGARLNSQGYSQSNCLLSDGCLLSESCVLSYFCLSVCLSQMGWDGINGGTKVLGNFVLPVNVLSNE